MPEPVAGTATPAVALASTASTVGPGDKALESTTNTSCGDSSRMELQPQEGMKQSKGSLSLPEESGTYSGVTRKQTATWGWLSPMTLFN